MENKLVVVIIGGEGALTNEMRAKIAAAPDLLETLQTAINWLRRIETQYPGSINEGAIDKHLLPAINKAQPQS